MIFNNLNFLPIPKYCQTCGIEKNYDNNENNDNDENEDVCHYAFCSSHCFKIASITHYGGAIIALQFFQGEPCIILIKDKSRKNYISELPGGRKKLKEGSGKTCARETTEEFGLKNPISYTYLENKGVRLVSWFKKNKTNINPPAKMNPNFINIATTNNEINTEDYYNYSIYVISIINFDIIQANLAVQSRLNDSNLQDEWKETESIYLVPIRNLENFINNNNNMILDYKDQPIPPLSTKWTKLLYNMDTIRIMKEVIYSNISPWNVKVKNSRLKDAFVWDHTDLIF
jgi:hypothetical protein